MQGRRPRSLGNDKTRQKSPPTHQTNTEGTVTRHRHRHRYIERGMETGADRCWRQTHGQKQTQTKGKDADKGEKTQKQRQGQVKTQTQTQRGRDRQTHTHKHTEMRAPQKGSGDRRRVKMFSAFANTYPVRETPPRSSTDTRSPTLPTVWLILASPPRGGCTTVLFLSIFSSPPSPAHAPTTHTHTHTYADTIPIRRESAEIAALLCRCEHTCVGCVWGWHEGAYFFFIALKMPVQW